MSEEFGWRKICGKYEECAQCPYHYPDWLIDGETHCILSEFKDFLKFIVEREKE